MPRIPRALRNVARIRSRQRPPRERAAPGTMPGSLNLPPGQSSVVTLRAIDYDGRELRDKLLDQVDDIDAIHARDSMLWLDIVGLDIRVLEDIGRRFGLHPLALEDVTTGQQRPKMEPYEDHLFIVLRAVRYVEGEGLRSHQVAIFVGRDFVITVREEQHGQFEPVRDRLRASRGRIRHRKTDYLAYALVDAVVDHYLPVMDAISTDLDTLAANLEGPSTEVVLAQVTENRQALLRMRRMSHPTRDVVEALGREQSIFTEETRLFLRDCADHVLTIIDGVELLREQASYLMDVHMALVNHRMNEVMKVLTVMSTVFIPLSFVAGLYGMNFDPEVSSLNMPETKWAYGYPFALAIMGSITVILLIFFYRKGWLTAGALTGRNRHRIDPPRTNP